jgi:hypothetical protein
MEDSEKNSTTTSLFLALGLVINPHVQKQVNDNYNPIIKAFVEKPISTISRQ